MAPLPTPKTPSDVYVHDMAVSLRALAGREDENESESGTVELREPVQGIDATPTVATSKGKTAAAPDSTGQPPAPFDPADHTVEQVDAYLADADDAERDRVLAAEKAGKGRKSIVGD